MPGGDDTLRDLGDGLVLRWSTAADAERLVTLNSSVFRDAEDDPPNQDEAAYTSALMSGHYPLMTPDDWAVVEDTRSGLLAAGSCLLGQTWRYGDVSFGVGRPELVATDPAYRRRGLIRAIFGLLHARSAARGDLAQAITGIPYFYRQFGYEYALDLAGFRRVHFADVPDAPADAADASATRPATAADIPFLDELYERSRARSLVSAAIPLDYWRYKVTTPATSNADWRVLILTGADGEALGFLRISPFRFGSDLSVRQLETAPGVGMRPLVPALLRALKALAPSVPTGKQLDAAIGVNFTLGKEHAWYEALGWRLAPRGRPPYAWYVRVADLPRFLTRIAPVLEARLAASVVAGHSGELRLDYFRGGLRLVFERGTLTLAEDWRRPDWSPGEYCAFPPLVFLQLLFGYRSLDDLRAAYPDVACPEELEALLRALFPPAPSAVLPLD